MLVFHIGYHKTASTWLRRAVFPRWSGITFQHRNTGVVAAWVRHLIESSDDQFLVSGMRATLDEVCIRAGRPVVVSNEDLSGSLFGGGRLGFRHAERLHQVAPDARILMVIRRQDEMARSIYAQYVNLGGYRSLTQFMSEPVKGCHFDARALAFDELVTHYITLFGHSNVRVVPYELLEEDPLGFLAHVADVCMTQPADVPSSSGENVSLSQYSMLALRGWNRAFRRTQYNPSPLVVPLPGASGARRALQRLEPRLPAMVRKRRATRREGAFLFRFAQQFATSNARTEHLAGLNLSRWNYALPARSQEPAWRTT